MAKPQAIRSPSEATGRERPHSDMHLLESFDECEDGPRQKKLSFLQGRLKCIPPIVSKTVRVFISSTFSDMVVERNALMEHVYPRLKDYCRQYGLEFQVVDMRWGVREEVQDDHKTSDLCMKAIEECQRVSMATTFVAMFGQKYGYRPFPVSIATQEFQVLRTELKTMGRDITLLSQWFQRDENVVPAVYSLVPISSRLPNYVNSRQPELQENDRELWWAIFQQLQELLREAATKCHSKGTLTDKEKEKYFISVTDDEIRHGILYDADRERQICFVRNITDLMDHLDHPDATKFIDMSDREKRIIDTEAQGLLRVLKDDRLPKWVSPDNIHHLQVTWSQSNGIDLYEHQEYIIELCETFYSSVCDQIAERVSQQSLLGEDPLTSEVLQHATMARKLIGIFQGREAILEEVKGYLTEEQDHPLVIHGESGSGKTSLMAMIAGSLPLWMSTQNPVVILRFLGTSPQSSSIFQLLQSVCNQIGVCYDVPIPDVGNDFSRLVALFVDLLQFGTYEEPLVVILDSLDQLSNSNQPNRLLWLPWKLPLHAYIIVSTLPENKLLPRLRSLIRSENNFVKVSPMGQTLSHEIVVRWLSLSNRTLTPAQTDIVRSALSTCSLPLYTKLVYEEVHRWKSTWAASATHLEPTVKGLINMLLDRMEKVHGRLLVSHALAYVTASRSGLTDAEIEDVLSLDDDVLDDVFTFWVPPIRRIPPLLWTRIRGDLRHYLVEREADNVTVLAWYHRQFQVTVRDRYLTDRNFRFRTHSALADYFLGLWGGGKKKPFRYSELLCDKLQLKSREGEADRKMPTQPLKWKVKHGAVTKVRYNLRKLTELPYHLYRSERYHELWQEVLYNYRWLHAKLKATSVVEVLADAMLVHKAFKNHRLGLLISALRVAGSSLRQLPNALASELLGRLKPHNGSNEALDSLVSQCRTQGLEDCALLPAFPCLDATLEALAYCLEGHCKPPVALMFSHDSRSLFSVAPDGMISVWEAEKGELINCVDVSQLDITDQTQLDVDGRGKIVLETYSEESQLWVVDPVTGMKEACAHVSLGESTHATIFGSNHVLREGTLIDLLKNEPERTLCCLSSQANFVTVAMTPNEKRLMVATPEKTALIDFSSEQVLVELKNPHIPSHIAITTDSRRAVISYSLSCQVAIYNINVSSLNFGKKTQEVDFPTSIPDLDLKTLSTSSKEVTDLKISSDNQKLLVTVRQMELFVVRLRDAPDTPVGLDLTPFHSQDWQVNAADFSYKVTLVVGIVNCQLCLWNVESGVLLSFLHLIGSMDDTFSLALAPNSPLVATTCSSELSIRLWDIEKLAQCTGLSTHVYRNPVDTVEVVAFQAIAFIKTYRRLSSRNGVKYLDYFGIDTWNLTTNQRKTFLPFNRYGQMVQMKASMNGRFMIIVTDNKITCHVFLLDLHRDRLLAHLDQPGCTGVQISPDCRHLITESTTDTKLWNLNSRELMKTFTNVQSCAFTTESKFALLIHETKRLLVFTLETREIKLMSLRKLCATRVTAVPKCAGLAMVTGFGKETGVRHASRVEMWDFVSEERLSRIDNVGSDGMLDFSKDGKLGVDSRLQVFNLLSGSLVCKPKFVESQERCHVRLTHDGAYMLWADREPADCIRVMHVNSGSVVAEVSTHARVSSLELADHGYLVLVGCEDGHLLTFRLHRVILHDALTKQDTANGETASPDSTPPSTLPRSPPTTLPRSPPSTLPRSAPTTLPRSPPTCVHQSIPSAQAHSPPCTLQRQNAVDEDFFVDSDSEALLASSPKQGMPARPNYIEFTMLLRSKLNRSNPNLKMVEPVELSTPPTDQIDKNANIKSVRNREFKAPSKPRLRFQKSVSDPNLFEKLGNTNIKSSPIRSTPSPTRTMSSPFQRMMRRGSALSDCSHEECSIAPTNLKRLDKLYQQPIESLSHSQVPIVGESTQQKLRAKVGVVYSISERADSMLAENMSRKASCRLM